MTTKTAIKIGAAIAALTAAPAYADFYDGAGLPPEKNWQEHIVVSHGINGISATAITKYIPANSHTVSIVAVGETAGTLHYGFAQGYRFDVAFDNGNYVGIVPMVQGSGGKDDATVVPTLYTTGIAGKWTVDPRVQAPMTFSYDGDATLDAVVAGSTIGLQVAEGVRVGPDIQCNVFARKESMQFSALLRYDPIGANGNNWMELQVGTDMNGTANSSIQYRINF